MEEEPPQKNNNDGETVTQHELKEKTPESAAGGGASNVISNKIHQYPPQQPIQPHYFPPQLQYLPGQFQAYAQMYPYPPMFGYHFPPPPQPTQHNIIMVPPLYAMPTPFATSVSPAISGTKDTPKKEESKDILSSSAQDETSGEASSITVTPTVSTETSTSFSGDIGSGSPHHTPLQAQTVTKTRTHLLVDSQISLQESISAENEPGTASLKLTSKTMGEVDGVCLVKEQKNVLNEATTHHERGALSKKQDEGDLLPCTSSKKQEENLLPCSSPKKKVTLPCSSAPKMAAIEGKMKESKESFDNNASPEKEKSKTAMLDDIDTLALRCANKKRKEREGVESLLLLSCVAEDMKSSENEDTLCHKEQKSVQVVKQSKKRKLLLPMRADRKDKPLPKRMPPPPQRFPAFFHFLLDCRQEIEKDIFSDEDTCQGLERTQKIAEEGARRWLKLDEDVKERWAEVSSRKYRGLLSEAEGKKR